MKPLQAENEVTETKEVIPAGYIPLNDDIVNMDTVVDFSATES